MCLQKLSVYVWMSKLASPEVSLSGLYTSREHKLNAGVPVGRVSADKTYILWQKKKKKK